MSLKPVYLEDVNVQRFEQGVAPPARPVWDGYYEKLLGQFQQSVDEQRLAAGLNNDFFSMAASVMAPVHERRGISDVSLFLMAHQTLDTHFPMRSITSLLCQKFAIEAPAFAFTEQECSAPYIALLTLLRSLESQPETGAALLLVLDQATVPYAGFDAGIDSALLMKLSTQVVGQTRVCHQHDYVGGNPDRAASVVAAVHAYLDARRLCVDEVHVVADQHTAACLLPLIDESNLSLADSRLMSCAGFFAMLEAQQTAAARPVLLIHLSEDEHLYQFLWRSSEDDFLPGGAHAVS